MKLVNLRNTVSGVVQQYDRKEADRLLKHRVWSKVLVEVNSEKNEVLSPPYQIEDGKRKPLKKEEETTESKAGNK